ncbi:MAG: polysaccharide biosynthesis tyrosine autokinase [Cyanobacteria bacterium P01_A01_bin.45]
MAPTILKRYLIAFDKYKWIGLTSFGLVFAGSTVVALQPEPAPNYFAIAGLSYTRPPVSFSATGTEIQQQGQQLSKEVLLSEQIIKATAQKVNVNPKKILDNVGLKMPEAAEDGATTGGIITIQYKDSDRNRTGETVKVLMAAMIQLSRDINTSRLKAITENIDQRLPQIKKELQAAERKLEIYDRVERPAILAAENGSLLNTITSSQDQQRQIKLTLSGIDAQLRSLQNKLGLNVNQAYISSALSADPIIANARTQIYQAESQMELLRKDLRPQHPTMIQLRRQKEAYERLLQQRAVEVIGGAGTDPGNVRGLRTQSSLDPARQQLANQLVALQTQRETLVKQLSDQIQQEGKLRREYSLIPNKQLERSRLEQQVALKKAIYDQVQTKLIDAKAAEAETISSLSVARSPQVKSDQEGKKPKSIVTTMGVGGFLGLIVGGGVIFLLGALEGTFKTKEDISSSLKEKEVIPLGELPLIPIENLDKDILPVMFSFTSPYLEYCEKLRSNIRRIGGSDLKVILITSTSHSEGKTFSAYHLGIASARAGKRTLIIETDLRSPSRCQSLKVDINPEASLEPLRYYSKTSECTHLVPDIENLYIIPSPGPVRNPAAILESSEMRQLIKDARQRYDFVILDTHTLSLSNDALLIQPYSDGMVLVARPNYTQENLLGEAIDQLEEAELNLVGAIINGADINIDIQEAERLINTFDIETDEDSEEVEAGIR